MQRELSKEKRIVGFKGFNPDMTCMEFQYRIGEEYEKKVAIRARKNRFHFCKYPLEVLGYYAPSSEQGLNRFCKVEGYGLVSKDGKDSKVACSKIHISTEIGLKGIIDASVKYIFEKVNWKNDKSTNTGNRSVATNTGDYSVATNTGDWSAATNTGDYSAATNTGDRSVATNTGNQSAATNTGDYSAATNTGDCSAATNTGRYSAASVEGKESIAIVTGRGSRAKGALGCWIVLTEYGEWDGKTHPIKEVKAFKVNGEEVKPDTWYKLIEGKLVEAEDGNEK